MHLRLLDILTLTPFYRVDLLLHFTLREIPLQVPLRIPFGRWRFLRQQHHAVCILAHIDCELVAGDMAAEGLRELRPHVLPGFGVPVDHVESLVAALGFHGRPEAELSVQAGVREAVEEDVECLATGKHEVAVELL